MLPCEWSEQALRGQEDCALGQCSRTPKHGSPTLGATRCICLTGNPTASSSFVKTCLPKSRAVRARPGDLCLGRGMPQTASAPVLKADDGLCGKAAWEGRPRPCCGRKHTCDTYAPASPVQGHTVPIQGLATCSATDRTFRRQGAATHLAPRSVL